jgi:iron complex outermembrane recepter protein
MQREVVSWHTKIKSSENQSLSTHLLFGDLFYETPGGLTKDQYLKIPKAARPASGVFPGAIQNNASVHQKMFWAGINHHYTFREHWKNTTAVYGAVAQIRNPSIRNYERRLEPNFGGRTAFNLNTSIKETDVHIVVGGEFQQGYADIKVYKNNKGKPDSLQSNDEVNNHQALLFAQADLSFAKGWILTAGVSLNTSSVQFNRISVMPSFNYTTQYNNEWAPRLSVLKKLDPYVSFYALVSKGFSPPTVAELLPSTSVINTNLQAEKGISYELGVRSSLLKTGYLSM